MTYSKIKSSDFQNIMTQNWKTFTINKLIDNNKELFDDGDWIEAEYITDEGIRLVQTGNIGEGEFIDKDKKKYISEESYKKLKCKELLVGDILICRLADPAGRACILPDIGEIKMVTSVDVSIFRPNNETVDRNYLVATFSTSNWFNEVRIKCGGSTRTRIARSKLGNIKFPLPPLPEQKAIAHILSLMDEAINKNNKLIAQKELRKKWLMQNLLTGKKRLKGFSKSTRLHKMDFGLRIPVDWEIINIEDVFKERAERSNDQKKYPLYSLTIENGVTEKTDRYERSFLLRDKENNQYKIVYHNDILFNPMNLRFGAIAKSNIDFKVLVSAYYNVIYKSSDLINIDYYDNLFRSKIYSSFYDKVAIGSLIEKKRVHLSNFLKLQIPLPSLKEQNAISEVIHSFDKEINLLKTKTQKLIEQKKWLMQVLLTGKKRLKI